MVLSQSPKINESINTKVRISKALTLQRYNFHFILKVINFKSNFNEKII